MPSRCSTSATSRCSGSSCGLLCCCASSIAAATASRAFSVYLLMFMVVDQPRQHESGFDFVWSWPKLLCGGMLRAFLQFLQCLEMFPLLRRQFLRQLHVDG